MNKRKFEDIIAEQGKLIYTNAGDSMYPTILPRDLLVIEAVTKPLKNMIFRSTNVTAVNMFYTE